MHCKHSNNSFAVKCYLFQDETDPLRYLSWADGFIIVYSITDRASFDKARDSLVKVTDHLKTSSRQCPLALVGNKIDLERYRVISKAEGQTLATDFEAAFYESTAAEEFEYVEDLFHGMIHAIQRERGERNVPFQPLYISDERYNAAQRNRPRSPRNSTDGKKEDKNQPKKNTPSFKLSKLRKNFNIFN